MVWFGLLRIYVALAVFQPYRDLEAGDNQSLKIQVARRGRSITPSKIDAKWQHSNLLCSSFKTKSCAKFQLNMSEHAGENYGKLCISYILSSKRVITPSKIDAKWWHSNLICSTLKQSHVQNFSSICFKHVGEKCGKLYFLHTKSTKKLNSFKNWRKVTTLELAL